MRAVHGLTIGALLLLGARGLDPGWMGIARAQEDKSYLQAPQGPYRGRVVELLTEKPLQGALVIIVWESDRDNDGDRSVFAVREALTDGRGEFAVDAATIETNLPPRAFPPGLLIYKMGYVSLPRELGRHFGVPASRFAAAGGLAQLKPVRSGGEWTETFYTFKSSVDRLRGEVLASSLREFFRVYRESLEHFGRDAPKNPGFWEDQ